MTLHIEKIDSIESLLDLLSGKENTRQNEMREARGKMEKLGYSKESLDAFAEFVSHIDALSQIAVTSMITGERLHHYDSTEFALSALGYMLAGLDNCHAMIEKAGVDCTIFGLRARSEGYGEFLSKHITKTREFARGTFEFTLRDPQGKVTTITAATKKEAAETALADLGYTIRCVTK